MKDTGNPERKSGTGRRSSIGRGSPERTQSMATRVLIILSIVAVIIVSGLLVLLVRITGGDQPAPQVTVTQSARQ